MLAHSQVITQAQQQHHFPNLSSPPTITTTKASVSSMGTMERDYYGNGATPPPPPPPRQYQQQQQQQQHPLGAARMEPVLAEAPVQTHGTPPRDFATVTPTGTPARDTSNEASVESQYEGSDNGGEGVDGDEALLDLAQLEELHQEAERMKALGNKHMAAQEYTRAYNAYSAALQLSPVGPSSHVFLSNRSAALLSLKRYSAAATDARRAIALAPSFGKAHARLGQSLYFLKDYEGAVVAYEDAIHYEPDNAVTRTYLEKAKSKLKRQKDKATRAARGEEVSVLTSESSMQATVVNSVATDTNGAAAVVTTLGFRGQSNAMVKAVGGGFTSGGSPSLLGDHSVVHEDEDPDFDEALRIQERANKYLANKNYKFAIEEYTAALFLVPDDVNLSPDLHLGRAHALNGSRRHESAKIDAQLAIKIKPTPEAYSTLAKSLFYMKDYQGSVDAFASCKDLLPKGESLSMFDRAYLQKAERALADSISDGTQSVSSTSTPIPKLKPPRFVPREVALAQTPQMPSMPKQWPRQSPRESNSLKVGPERNVVFLSEALGIKLNRGPDGIVRVLEVSPELPGSPIARKGHIEVGDIVREAGGVDIRRPITNVMWGDTVALIKMAPRPIVVVVAKELSMSPPSIAAQRRAAAANSLSPTSAATVMAGGGKVGYGFYPSNSNGDESVRQTTESSETVAVVASEEEVDNSNNNIVYEDEEEKVDAVVDNTEAQDAAVAVEMAESVKDLNDNGDGQGRSNSTVTEESADKGLTTGTVEKENGNGDGQGRSNSIVTEESGDKDLSTGTLDSNVAEDGNDVDIDETIELKAEQEKMHEPESTGDGKAEQSNLGDPPIDPAKEPESDLTLRDQEAELIGCEILFERKANPCYNGWDNLRWMSYSGARKVRYCELMSRLKPRRKALFWSGDQYVTRKVAVYDEPRLILVLRPLNNVQEMSDLLDLPQGSKMDDGEKAMNKFVVVESVFDPKTCKLRMSPLTTPTSVLDDVPADDYRRRSCFELITPTETIALSAVRLRSGAERVLTSFSDSGAFLETSCAEMALKKALCESHTTSDEIGSNSDISWKHQIILGTLHSYAVLGNQAYLDKAIAVAMKVSESSPGKNDSFLDPRVVDALDENGRSPLHYACSRRSSAAVASLVKAGANLALRMDPHGMTPTHICAKNLDHKSLTAILSYNRRPNTLDDLGRTPMYVAIMEGCTVGGMKNSEALGRCLAVLSSHGGQLIGSKNHRHPLSALASGWQAEELTVVLEHICTRYPLSNEAPNDSMRCGISLGASFQYPVHSSLISLRKKIKGACDSEEEQRQTPDLTDSGKNLISTLQLFLESGFEPNERIEGFVDSFDGMDELAIHIGFAPVQILAAASLDASAKKEVLGDALFSTVVRMITDAAELLVKNGARISLDPPPKSRTPLRKTSYITGLEIVENGDFGSCMAYPVDRSAVKIQSNKTFEHLLGLKRLNEAQAAWKADPTVRANPRVFLYTDNKGIIEDSEAPGGSDERTCAICWKVFGKLMNRRHRCRITRRHVCDECSSKRIVQGDEEYRISDGQFLLAKFDYARERREEAEKKQETRNMSEKKVPVGSASARLMRLEAEERANRESLFGGVMENVAKAVFGNDEETGTAARDRQIGGLNETMGQARDALNERGEKLNTLADKSDKLVNASKDFASMAKELNRASKEQGLFW